MAEHGIASPVAEGLKAVAYALDVPAAELKGYIVIGVKHDDSYLITGNLSSQLELVSILGDVVHVTTRDLATEYPPDMIT